MSILLKASLLTIALSLRVVDAARSLSARRVRGAPTARSADRYDRSITTFSPDGRLLQLEYALIAAEERGRGLTVCVECGGVVVFAFPSAVDYDDAAVDAASSTSPPSTSSDEGAAGASSPNDECKQEDDKASTNGGDGGISASSYSRGIEYNPTHNTKVHRLSPTHLLLTSGLSGDARTLASAFRRLASQWTHITYGEAITARELAREMGSVRHSIGLRPGARVLGVVGMLIGLDDADGSCDGSGEGKSDELGVEVRMYRSLPGGTIDRCNVCCTGGGADAAGSAARKDATETLLNLLSTDNGGGIEVEDDEQSSSTQKERTSTSIKEQKLQKVVEEVGRLALKHHPESQSDDEISLESEVGGNGKAKKRPAVDIWVVRATSKDPQKQQYASISPHRYLGKALMDTRYARRVAVDQISHAAKCLLVKNEQIH